MNMALADGPAQTAPARARKPLLFLASLILAATSTAKGQQDPPPAPYPPPAPSEFVELLRVEPRGGRVVRPDDFELTKPDAAWRDQSSARLVFEQTYQDQGSYWAQLEVPPAPEPGRRAEALRREVVSRHGIPVKQNRNYVVSVLIKTDFDRKNTEINMHLRFFDKLGNRASSRQSLGVPAVTQGPDGWQRCEWTTTVPIDPLIHEGRAAMYIAARPGDRPVEFRIADFAFVELPAKPLKPLPRGEGVTFPGGAGDLPMKVESAKERDGHLIVETTGARYDFDLANDTITASQRIEFPRELARWQSSLSLKDLRIDKRSDDVCVLSNDQMTIGIQCDSLMVISPRHELRMKLTNLLGGDWNRYERGSLLSEDDFGGFTVNPYIPAGTGLKPQSELLTKGLSFEDLTSVVELEKWVAQGGKSEGRALWSLEEPGAAEPGWEARWTSRPGELFCTSVFPPRPFPWKDSFTKGWRLLHRHRKLPEYLDNQSLPFVSHLLLWDFIPRTWGGSYSPTNYEPWDADQFREAINVARARGFGVIPYISAFWTPTREPEVYIDAVRKFKEKYDIDGVYSDGLPHEDWMVAYKEMRMLRELFPSGMLVIHDSIAQDRWSASQFKPFLHTYATIMYLAENEESRSGIHWQYPRYITTQFRKANSIGTTKGDKWTDPEGEVMGERNWLVSLVYNGRNNLGYAYRDYNKFMEELYQLWKEKGGQPYFYDRYYLPTAQRLTGYRIGRAAMPIVERESKAGKVTLTLKSLTPDAVIHYTTDGQTPTKDSPRYQEPMTLMPNSLTIKARAFAEGLDPSAVAKEPLGGE